MVRRTKYIMLSVICGAALAITALVFALRLGSSRRMLFRQIVVDPIPASVKHIRADSHHRIGAHTHIIRFEIGTEHLLDIVDSGGFTRLGPVRYSAGMLTFGLTDEVRRTASLYRAGRKPPRWFDLAQWKEFAAYVVEQERENSRYQARLVLFNKQLGTAYFIEQEARGHWGGGPVSVTDPRSQEVPESVRQRIEEEAPEWVREQTTQADGEKRNDTNLPDGSWDKTESPR